MGGTLLVTIYDFPNSYLLILLPVNSRNVWDKLSVLKPGMKLFTTVLKPLQNEIIMNSICNTSDIKLSTHFFIIH